MSKLKIELEAIYQNAEKGFNKTTDSVDALRKTLITTGKEGEKFDQAVFRELTSAGERFGYELKGLEKALDLVRKQMSYLSQGVGEDNAQLEKLAKTTALYQAEIDKLNEAKSADAKRTKEQIAAAEEMNNIQRQTIQMLEERARVQNQLNSKNANIGFMMLTDDRIGVANYALKEYEQTLKQVIADTGINSEETQKALAVYQEQAKYVESLKEETSGYGAVLRNTAPAVDKFATATKELDQTSKGYLTRLVTLTKNILTFQLIMGPIRSAISGVKNTLRESLNVAAEAEQTYSKLATVFDGFEKSASRAATSLASTLGVAKSTASGALSTVGDLLQAQGMGTAESLTTASRWTSQFYDIINFKDINMSLEEFAQNFMSGAAGNLRNFRTFGSIVKESAVQAELARKGLDKLTGSQLELAKMTTRAEMALRQQANAMGATQREWDTTLSVTRRLTEAWKEYKENLGDTLNSFVKPIKRDITELLDRVNKVKRAAKELEGGAAVSSVYDIRNNENDRAAFRKDLLTEFNSYEGDLNRYANGTITSSDTLAFEALDYVMRMYAASLEDVTNILGNKLPEAAAEYLKSLENTRNAEIELQKAIDGRKAQISTASDRYNAFAESLLGISGVSFTASSFSDATGRYSQTENGTAQLLGIITSTMFSDVDAALASINSSDLAETWGGVIAGALDELDKGDLLQGRIDSVRQLFENTWNEFLPDGFTEQEKAKLEEIKATYKGYVDELDAYNEELKRLGSFASALSGMGSVTASYDVQLAQLGMTNDQKLTDNLRRQYAEAYALAATPEEQQQIDDAYAEAEQTLLAFLNAQRIYNEELEKEAAEKERLAQYEEAVKTISESTADYAAQMVQVGMTDNEKALDDLRIVYEKMRSELTLTEEEAEALDAEYDAQRQALINLQARQKEYNDFLASEAARLAAAEAAVTAMRNGQSAQGIMANYAMTTINPLQATGRYASADTWRAGQRAGLRETEAQLLELGVAASEVNAWIAEMIPLINEGYEAKKAEIDATEKETEALRKAQQWLAVEQRVTGSMGTLGGIIETFQGEGDIWSKLVNALLTILENTESWPKMAETLDSIFNMFEPVAEALLDLIMSLPWEDIIFMLKVVASAITIISAIVQGIQTVIKWLWNNIKTALKNVATDVYNLFHPFNQRSRDQYTSFEELGNMLAKIYDDTTVYLERIWNANEDIVRNTDKDNLALLRDLYARKIINEDQFYAGARVIQKDMIFDPVSADSTKYVSRGAGASSSVSYGGVTIQFNGSNSEEMKRWITDFFNQNGIGYNVAIGG